MKICVLGNSHAGSLKKGWDSIQDTHPNHQITFFASRGRRLDGLILKNQTLVPTDPQLSKDILYTSGVKEEIPLNDYDLFVLYGLGLTLPPLDSRLSSAVIRQACLGSVSQSLNYKLAKLIRVASSAPIYIGHNPQRASLKKRSQEMLCYEEVMARMKVAVDINNVHLISQPDCTLANGWDTSTEYSKGSTRLDVGDKISNELHPEHDMGHMNGKFGSVYLESFFQLVNSVE